MKITLGSILMLIALANINVGSTYRLERSPQEKPWEISHVTKTDDDGNLNAGVNVKNDNFHVGWDQIFDGSGKSKPNLNIGGTYKFKRSPQEKPWEISHVTKTNEDGNLNAGVNVKNDNLNIGWDQVFDGSGKSKPNFNIAGTYRFKRSPQKKQWEIGHITNTDENGNIKAGVNVKHDNFNFGWDQVFDGSGKSKPSFNFKI
ncbi:unnamed protein product [Psylliodes chrysocephalus]|uniref:Uncharacterized protein n=1 Tax=Psylliodes chrysocephalus TaxID=3402493 RepID=A0A9P0GAW2_9CUCU|nr:unnamed protein product [Psylliodes chrysocephala]